ncbi:MAG: rRNA ((1402)-N(4))-methyltransferase RsmH [Akkermansiaceae bacterium]|nr:rRNA ((1402)-N(4))-methyltransferase RsmH [Akkermansiaceae bacterium]
MLFAHPTPAPGKDRSAAPTVKCDPMPGLGAIFQAGWTGGLGTALLSIHTDTIGRSASHGWLAERRSSAFQAGRKRFLGTVPLSLFKTVVRAASGWLPARATDDFHAERTGKLGTVSPSVYNDTTARPVFLGWLAERRSLAFQAGRKRFLGTVPLSLFKTVVRAASGWLPARTTDDFLAARTGTLGTEDPSSALDTASRSSSHGWLGERSLPDFMAMSDLPGADYHLSVLPAEVTEWMQACEGKFIIDGTLGGGGHSETFLKAGASVLGVDRDPDALAYATKRLAPYGDRFQTWQGNFADLRENLEIRGVERANGMLLDLGVSSFQLDSFGRGFSFRGEGPLDMRMGPSCAFDAEHVVNDWSEADLLKILREFGEEPQARRIVAAILKRRAAGRIKTTTELAGCIEKEIGRHGKTHPATRTFQAIRMAVNDELGSLERMLDASIHLLKPGGRLLVITFHSLEDRLVKRFMQDRAKPFLDHPAWPEPRPNPEWYFRLPVRKAIAAGDQELRVNPRARSAKLRVAELLDTTKESV